MPNILVDASRELALAATLALCALACGSDGSFPAASNAGSAGSTPTAGSAGSAPSSGGSGGTSSPQGGSTSRGSNGSSGSAGSGGGTGTPALCNIADPFSPFTSIAELNTANDDRGARLTTDELMVVFSREGVIYEAQRPSRTAQFGPPRAHMGIGNSAYGESAPWISDDGLVLFFEMQDLDGTYSVRRQSRNEDFVGDRWEAEGFDPYIVGGANGVIYVNRQNDGIWAAPLDNWNPGEFGLVSADRRERPVVSLDQLTMYATGGFIEVSQRATTSEPFETWTIVDLPEPFVDFWPSWISPDGCRLYVDGQLEQLVDLAFHERSPP